MSEANVRRNNNARKIMKIWGYGMDDIETTAIDALTDLLHAAEGCIDLEMVARCARENYEQEKEE